MRICYARTSTVDQTNGLDAQITELKAAGCDKLFTERVSSIGRRAELDRAIDFAREGDAFVVTKLDRLARDTRHLLTVAETLESKGVALEILNIKLDTSTPTGRLMLTLLGAVASFEREMMLERQREGIAASKKAGKYKGRQPTARAKASDVQALYSQGVGPTEIARKLRIGRASVYRILANDGVAQSNGQCGKGGEETSPPD